MSGTSFDAIDAAWVDFSDSGQPVVVDFESSPMSQALRSSLFKLQSPLFSDLHESQLVAIQHADETAQVVCRLIDRQQRYRSSLRAVAIHGQTVRHQPKLGYTVQLLQGLISLKTLRSMSLEISDPLILPVVAKERRLCRLFIRPCLPQMSPSQLLM